MGLKDFTVYAVPVKGALTLTFDFGTLHVERRFSTPRLILNWEGIEI